MIHVSCPPAPIDFAGEPIRLREVAALRSWLSLPQAERGPAPLTERRQVELPYLIGRLEVVFLCKCAFCETRLEPGKGKLMFYRPIGSGKSQTDGSARGYTYPWLAWDWSNYYYTCRDCLDMRESGFRVTEQHAVGDVLDLERENATAYYWEEKPLLLDPRIDVPVKDLDFTEDGWISARDNAKRGQYTIANLRLNRPALVDKRKEDAQQFKRLWLLARKAFFDDPTGAAPDVVGLAAALAAQCQPNMPFAGMKAYLLLEWLISESKVAMDSGNQFAAALKREPWLQVYQAAMTTLWLEKPIDSRLQASEDKSAIYGQGQMASGTTQANAFQIIYIKGDMYQIGSVNGGTISIGSGGGPPKGG
jgi:hypothetical protein